ncbi:MAG: hypothetical protein OEM90_18650 [Desulfobacteraceae bacterium]|jgi:hypothetical protein|nr:hypothetical protein [Desulfobacteraceae bacterium]
MQKNVSPKISPIVEKEAVILRKYNMSFFPEWITEIVAVISKDDQTQLYIWAQ